MAVPLKQWLHDQKIEFKDVSNREISERYFHRDPIYASILDRSKFYSPADGTLIYQKVIQPHEEVEIKGKMYSLSELFEGYEVPTVPCLCMAIFMTMWDVHTNKVPYSGLISYRMAHPIRSYNLPMDIAEDDIMAKEIKRIQGDMHDFEVYNARMISRFYNPGLDYSYWVIQIADDAVGTVAHFTSDQNVWFDQCQRFSLIRFGSQVDMILPLDPRFELKPIWPDLYHVAGGLDPIVHMERLD